jgi:hypothetical protein
MKWIIALTLAVVLLMPGFITGNLATAHPDHEATLRVVDAVTGAPLKGGFTPEERSSMLHVYNALLDVYEAVSDMSWSGPGVTSASRTLFAKLGDAHREGRQAWALLLHVNPDATSPSYDARETRSRSEWVDEAWFHLDRFLLAVQAAKEIADQQGYTRLRDIWLPYAINEIDAVDRTLSYATPLPADVSDQGMVVEVTPGVAGPNGELRPQGWALHRCGHYAGTDAWSHAVSAFASTGVQPGTGGFFKREKDFLRVVLNSQAAVWELQQPGSPPPERPTMNRRFVSTETVWMWLTDFLHVPSTPFHFQQIFDELAAWGQAAPNADLWRAAQKVSDGWRHCDLAMWDGIQFTFLNEDPTAGQ